MTASVLLYLALAAAAVGALCLIKPLTVFRIRTRRGAGLLLAAALTAAVGVALWPAPLVRSAGDRSIDRFLTTYNFHERHQIRIFAAPDAVYRATLAVTADEIRWLKPLLAIRQLRAPRGRSDVPLLEVATRGSFVYLAREPPRELVVGTIGRFWSFDGGRGPRPSGPDEFLAIQDPSYARAVMNFTVEDAGGLVSLLTTETRIFAPEGEARRRFAAYWRLIYPGSSLIRVSWLAAIKRRAEAGS